MAETVLGGVIGFFQRIGIYDVVLPFLLTFTIVFAILEKTRVFGVEKIEGADYPRKNLNAMAAFAIGFMVVASSKIVEALASISSQMVVLLFLSVFFLMLVGTFIKEGDIAKEGYKGAPQAVFAVIMAVGIVIILLNSLKTENNQTWLEYSIDYISNYWSSTGVASIILVIILIAFIVFITKGEGSSKEKSSGSSGGG